MPNIISLVVDFLTIVFWLKYYFRPNNLYSNLNGFDLIKKVRKPIPEVKVKARSLLEVDMGVEDLVIDSHSKTGWGKIPGGMKGGSLPIKYIRQKSSGVSLGRLSLVVKYDGDIMEITFPRIWAMAMTEILQMRLFASIFKTIILFKLCQQVRVILYK